MGRSAFRALLGLALIAGCSSAADGDDESTDEDDISSKAPSADEIASCPGSSVGKNAEGDTVVRCTKPFDTAPLVRPPADAVGTAGSTSATIYAALTVPTTFEEQAVAWTREGKRWVFVDASGAAVPYSKGKLPRGLHAPTNRSTFTVYQLTGVVHTGKADTAFGEATKLEVKSARAVVEIDGCAFDSRLLGTWEGDVSQRYTTPIGSHFSTKNFDAGKRVPIHVTLSGIEKQANLADFKSGGRIKDAEAFVLHGVIDNFDKDVDADGKHYASLKSLGGKSPFYQATDGKVDLFRLGNMHGQNNDGHWVLDYPAGSKDLTVNGMSYTLTSLTAATFLMEHPGVLDTVTIQPHIPFAANGHTVTLTPVAIGKSTGQCAR